ncbi:hypothetical protein ACFV2U_47455 [Streptomyces sp. NPDC059697]|uniref:hypothetical protein n=1 Tax=Streptomyces sp. NPDC059697 TaxID=3346912 RepID=UPI0036C7A928
MDARDSADAAELDASAARRHFRDPHVRGLRQLTAHDQIVRDTVMNTPGVRQVLAATALQVQGYSPGRRPRR